MELWKDIFREDSIWKFACRLGSLYICALVVKKSSTQRNLSSWSQRCGGKGSEGYGRRGSRRFQGTEGCMLRALRRGATGGPGEKSAEAESGSQGTASKETGSPVLTATKTGFCQQPAWPWIRAQLTNTLILASWGTEPRNQPKQPGHLTQSNVR